MATRNARSLRGGWALCLAAALLLPAAATAAERVYYVAADTIVWDYAPSFPTNLMTSEPFNDEESLYLQEGKNRIGRRVFKAVYREYTDGSFNHLKPRAPGEESLGILGPIIRAEVGDSITVHFRNNTAIPVGMHPHGVFYDKASEGAHYSTGPGTHQHETGAHVAPLGGQYVYHWEVPERAGPGPADPDSVAWLYHAHDHENLAINAGLIGAIIITRKGKALPDGRAAGVDREFVVLFMIFDENKSPYLDANISQFTSAPQSVKKDEEEFKESNKKHGINGLLWGNLDGLTMKQGERVRWYLIGLGNENDIHTAHWHGATVLKRGSRVDTVELFPATTEVVDMRPDDVGTWMFHCHVADHMAGGMMTRYTVTQ
jgi:FtsP/CotA-like multicopper oxidase with cupredoxin domain